MENQMVFERYELKYLMSRRQQEEILRAMEPHMKPDRFGHSSICNIYYDTPDFRLIRHSLEKPVYKEKLRVRSYGPAGPEDPVFVELKKKYREVVYKRRIVLPQARAAACLGGR
ncbi:MAG: VTC domain-containing protein, partial [Gemmiger sp.]